MKNELFKMGGEITPKTATLITIIGAIQLNLIFLDILKL